MFMILDRPIVTYLIGMPVVWFGTMLTLAFWSDGQGEGADDLVLPMSIAGGLFWPVALLAVLCFWFWQMIKMFDRFLSTAFPEPPAPTSACNHPIVPGASYCPRCGRPVAQKGQSSGSAVHSD